jgi:hypothetical protein
MADLPLEHSTSLDEAGVDEVFFGRDKELQATAASMATVLAGTGHIDLISGPAGIGKTRLAREVATAARTDGFQVLRGGCWEGDGAPAYWPWIAVLRSYLEAAGDEAAAEPDFSRLLAAASARVSVVARATVDPSKDAQQARFVLFDWVCEFFAGVTARQPIMLVLDDLHWADTSSLLLLQFVVGRLASLPIAIIATSRDPIPDLLKSITQHHEEAEHLPLPGLSREEACELLNARSAYTPEGEVLDHLMGLTEGNPYFLRELAQLWRGGHGPTDPSAILALPPSLLAFTLHQFDRLSLTCRRLLQAASVIGREFNAELVAQVAQMEIPDAMRMLDDAVEHRVLVPLAATRFHFRHALVREAIQGQVNLGERTHLHERIALALEQQAQAGERVPATALAHHFSMGLPFTHRRRAGAYSITAGEEAHAAFAYEEAVFQFRRAQEMCWTILVDGERCDLLLLLGAAEAGAGEWGGSRYTFDEAAALARALDSPDRFARAALGFKGLMSGTLPIDVEAITLLQEALERLSDDHPSLRVHVCSAISDSLYFSDDRERILYYSQLATDLAHTLNDDRARASALTAAILADWRPSEAGRLKAHADELLRLGIRCRDSFTAFHSRMFRYWSLSTLGRTREALQDLHHASSLPGATEHPRLVWQLALLRSSLHISRGQLDSAALQLDRVYRLGQRVHDSSPAHHHLMQSLQLARFTKDLHGWISTAASTIDRYSDALSYHAARAFLCAHFGQFDDAHLALCYFTSHNFENIPSNTFTLLAYAILSEAVIACGDAHSADRLYDLLLPHRDLNIVAGWGTVLDGSVSHYLALLASSMGRRPVATKHFQDAVERNALIEAPPLLARTQLEFSRFLAQAPDNESQKAAIKHSSSALRVFGNCSMDAYARDATLVLEALSGGITRSPSSTPPQHSHVASSAVDTDPILGLDDVGTGPQNALLRKGDVWIVRYRGESFHVRHLVGFSHIAAILLAGGRPVHVLDLAVGGTFEPAQTMDLGSDSTARKAYKQRLRALGDAIEEATTLNDIGRLDALHTERDALLRELSYSYGLSGRSRPSGSATERARVSVKNRITSALAVVRQYNEPAWRHLSTSIKTGALCHYIPEDNTTWVVEPGPEFANAD